MPQQISMVRLQVCAGQLAPPDLGWQGEGPGLLCCVVQICESPKSQPTGTPPEQRPEASPAHPWPQWVLSPWRGL